MTKKQQDKCGWDCARGKTCINCDQDEINNNEPIIQDVIEVAIRGGWSTYKIQGENDVTGWAVKEIAETEVSRIALDPEFYKAIGKEMGWNKEIMGFQEWMEKAGGLMDYIIYEGGTAEDYLISLIK